MVEEKKKADIGEERQAQPGQKKEKPVQSGKKKEHPGNAQARTQQEKEKTATADPYTVLSFVQMTERAVQGIEQLNRLVFIVNRKSTKQEIRQAAERAFNTKITKVNTLIDQRGRKRAFITFAKAGEAGEIAIRLGII